MFLVQANSEGQLGKLVRITHCIFMKRIMIIGICGAGKSTLAGKLQPLLELKLIHLDQHYWQPNWVEPTKEAWTNTVKELVKRDAWIMDGNFGRTMDIRLERADTIIYLNYPTGLCLWRVWQRVRKYNGRTRPDMTEGCPERLDIGFLWYILTFKHRTGRRDLNKLEKLKREKQLFILNNDRAVEAFLNSVTPSVF
jgi:adenylate kinase family enzyme